MRRRAIRSSRCSIVLVFAKVAGRGQYDRGLRCVVDAAPTGAWTPTSSRRSDAEISAFELPQETHLDVPHHVHDVERVLGVAPSIGS